MSKHKHAEVIKQWADGAEIEVRMPGSSWRYSDSPLWCQQNEYRVKPSKVYPVTQMMDIELQAAVDIPGQSVLGRAKNIANAALRHACDTGQVVPIGEIVVMGRESRAARDMAIAEAVRNASRAAAAGASTLIYGRISGIDLAAIIAQVKP